MRLVSWKHESIGRVLSEHQLGIYQHEGSFVFIIHPTQKCPLITEGLLKEELWDLKYVIWTAISHGQITTAGSHRCIIKKQLMLIWQKFEHVKLLRLPQS